MYNTIKYSNNYSKTSRILWKYCRNEPNDKITDSFKFKSRFFSITDDDSTVNVEIAVPLKYFINFQRTLKMPLIKCEISTIFTWSANYVICDANRAVTSAVIDTKLCVSVTLPT